MRSRGSPLVIPGPPPPFKSFRRPACDLSPSNFLLETSPFLQKRVNSHSSIALFDSPYKTREPSRESAPSPKPTGLTPRSLCFLPQAPHRSPLHRVECKIPLTFDHRYTFCAKHETFFLFNALVGVSHTFLISLPQPILHSPRFLSFKPPLQLTVEFLRRVFPFFFFFPQFKHFFSVQLSFVPFFRPRVRIQVDFLLTSHC